MLRRLLGLSLLLAGLAAMTLAGPAPAQDKKDEGFVQLFNGKDLTGWKLHPEPNKGAIKEIIKKEKNGKVIAYYGKGKDDKEFPLWRVEDGILIGSGPASHLFTERGDYENFIYRV